MGKAIQNVTNGISKAALQYQVLCSTLSDHVTWRVCPGAAPGPPKCLCEEEEEELDSWLCRSGLCQKCT